MRAVMIAVLIASSSGCLVHERPDAIDAAVTPDAFVGRDAHDAFALPDAYAHDSNFPPLQQCLGGGPGMSGGHWDLQLRACALGARECLVEEVTTVLDDTFWGVRCAPQSTQTVVRATLLAASSTSSSIEACLPDGTMCTTTVLANVGDVVEIDGHTEPQAHAAEIYDRFRFRGEGARFQVEVCAIGPCP